jgi:hypothetical protein
VARTRAAQALLALIVGTPCSDAEDAARDLEDSIEAGGSDARFARYLASRCNGRGHGDTLDALNPSDFRRRLLARLR